MTDFQPIQFVDADAQRIQQELLDAYKSETEQVLYPGDPRRIYLLQFLPSVVALKNGINYTGNQNLLSFATDTALDALGERIGVPRLKSQPAKVILRFTLSAVQSNPVMIPTGTRVTPDGVLYFATTADLSIASGSTYGDITAESTQGGEKYNGFIPGRINAIVDPVPFVSNVSNINTSYDGADEESDAAYRDRQRIAPASFSVAGPTNAYIFFAKSADVNIADVSVTSPNPGEVNVYVLMKNGQLPDQSIIDNVLTEINADDRRPLTDLVRVLAPTAFTYNIDVTYYISADRSAEVSTIRAAIEGSGGAIDQYEQWQNAKLGRAITPDDLQSKMYYAGAYRVVVTSPVYAEINPNEVAQIGTKNIVYGGLI